jgi:hypothetical protein
MIRVKKINEFRLMKPNVGYFIDDHENQNFNESSLVQLT